MDTKNQRLIGPDILRAFAIIAVVCGHFFSVNTTFNDAPFTGASMFVQGFLKSIFCNTGVPLFLMLTGYFNLNKQLSKEYFYGIKRAWIPYVIISLITWAVLSPNHSPLQLVLGVLGFKTIGYAWYVEMYVGLFLLIPFINIILEKVFADKQQTKMYFIVMILLTALPQVLDRGDYKLIPRFWEMDFPVLYYSIGAAIRHFQPSLGKYRTSAVFIMLILWVIGPVSMYLSNRMGGAKLSLAGSYYSVVHMAAVTILFVLLYKVQHLPKCLSKAIASVALCSYEMFLFSYMMDKLIYPVFIERFYTTQSEFLLWFVPITVCSLVASYVSARAYRWGCGLNCSKCLKSF